MTMSNTPKLTALHKVPKHSIRQFCSREARQADEMIQVSPVAMLEDYHVLARIAFFDRLQSCRVEVVVTERLVDFLETCDLNNVARALQDLKTSNSRSVLLSSKLTGAG